MFLIAMFAGMSAGVILVLLSHLAPFVGAGNFIHDLDNPHVFGKELTRRESHFLGMLVHVALSMLFGLIYAVFVSQGVFASFHFWTIIAWSLVMWVFVGMVVLPFEGHGIFGMREDAWFPLDLVVTHLAWAVLFWWIMNLWPERLM